MSRPPFTLIMLMLDEKSTQIFDIISHCNNCGQCSLTCPTHFHGLFNPLGVLRAIQMGNIREAITDQPLFNCLTCNRCMTYCPNSKNGEGMNFAVMMRLLREYAHNQHIPIKNSSNPPGLCTLLVDSNYNPEAPEAPETPEPPETPKSQVVPLSLEDISDVEFDQYFGENSSLSLNRVEQGEIAFFVGDLPLYQKKVPQFFKDFTQILESSVKILNQVDIIPVIINMKPLGHDDYWAGHTEIFTILAHENVRRYKEAGVKTIIVESAEAYRTWRYDYPEVVEGCDFAVFHLSQYLFQTGKYKKLKIDASLSTSYTFADSSRLGRLGGGVYEEPRQILSKVSGAILKEMDSNRQEAFDCGTGMYLEEVEETNNLWNKMIEEIASTKADYFITTSPKTLLHYSSIIATKPFESRELPIVKDWAVFLSRFLV
ncbi:MAG: (Fe-S)-binding protein [Promethearchaeota archaeon]